MNSSRIDWITGISRGAAGSSQPASATVATRSNAPTVRSSEAHIESERGEREAVHRRGDELGRRWTAKPTPVHQVVEDHVPTLRQILQVEVRLDPRAPDRHVCAHADIDAEIGGKHVLL